MFFRALKPLTFSLMICLILLLKHEQKLEKRERLVEEGCCDQIDTCQDLVNFFLIFLLSRLGQFPSHSYFFLKYL